MKKLALVLALLLTIGIVSVSAEVPSVTVIEAPTVTISQDASAVAPTHIFMFSWAGDNAGLAANVWTFSNDLPTAFRDWNVWAKFLDGKLKVSAGLLRDGSYRLTDFIPYQGDGLNPRITGDGLLLQVFPIDGLSVGVDLSAEGGTLTNTLSDLDFYVSYTAADIVKVIGGALLGTDFAFYAGIDLLAVEGLDLRVVYNNGTGSADLGTSVGFGMVENLYAAVDFDITFASSVWKLNFWANYDLGIMNPNLLFGYNSASAYDAWVKFDIPTSNGFISPGFAYGYGDGLDGTAAAWRVPIYIEMVF